MIPVPHKLIKLKSQAIEDTLSSVVVFSAILILQVSVQVRECVKHGLNISSGLSNSLQHILTIGEFHQRQPKLMGAVFHN
jgi:hypothetical protein